METPSSSLIKEVGTGFRQSKTLLSAVELGLFTALGAGAMTGSELLDALGLHPRANPDFFDALVALRFLERDGAGPEARYRNTPETASFLDRRKTEYVGGLLEMANDRLYPAWGELTTALRTGQPQSETRNAGVAMFQALTATPSVASNSSTRWPERLLPTSTRWRRSSIGHGIGACATSAERAACCR